jgi:hypothetical protein
VALFTRAWTQLGTHRTPPPVLNESESLLEALRASRPGIMAERKFMVVLLKSYRAVLLALATQQCVPRRYKVQTSTRWYTGTRTLISIATSLGLG